MQQVVSVCCMWVPSTMYKMQSGTHKPNIVKTDEIPYSYIEFI